MHPKKFVCRFSCVWIIATSMFHQLHSVSAEIFSSTADVEKLVITERKVLDILHKFQKQERQKATASIRLLRGKKNMLLKIPYANALKWMPHPTNVLSFTKLFVAKRIPFLECTLTGHRAETLSAIARLKKVSAFPNDQDHNGTAEAFHRLQQTYKIHPENIASGSISGIRTSPVFTFSECFIIGFRQAQEGFYGSAAEWLRIALQRLENETSTGTIINASLVKILDWLQYSVYHHNRNVVKVLELTKRIKQLDQNYANVDANLRLYSQVLANATDLKKFEAPTPPFDFGGGVYEALCRGEVDTGVAVQKHLRCYYEHHKNPFLFLQPIKMEVVHNDPDVFILHNILLESQMAQIKAVGQQLLQRAAVVDVVTKKDQVVKERVSKTGFLEEKLHPIIAKVHKFSGQATNLNSENAEQLQLNNYGIGGHYASHHDHMRKDHPQIIEPHVGDRIATLLIYMSDVEAGGATVFPKLNLALFPEKGSAAFWYNLHLDGIGIDKTLHAGCPVLSGNKWVSNIWFREVQQDLTRPCGLKPDGPIEPAGNITEIRTFQNTVPDSPMYK